MSIADNLACMREKILSAERLAGRSAGSVQLMAVSKFNPAEAVRESIHANQILFGENRVQEASDKFAPIIAECPEVELHLIGSLQRNKVRQIIKLVSCIQSVDRIELLTEIEKQAAATGRKISVLFEYHTGESSKSGYGDRDSLFHSIDSLRDMQHVICAGLMTMAPFTSDQTLIRASFRTLVSVQHDCQTRYPSLNFNTLSMGMSSDYEIAIQEGSTMVRIGTAIFGARS